MPHIARHRRPHGGIGDGGQGPLVFLHFGQDIGGDGDRQVGKDLGADRGHAPLMGVIDVAVDETDGDRLDALGLELFEPRPQRRLVDVAHHAAIRADALGRLDRAFQRRERLRLGPDDPAGQPARHIGPRDLQDLPVAFRDDKADPRPLALQHRIGGYRGAMEEPGDVPGRDAGLGADGLRAVDHGAGGVVGRGGQLAAPGATGLVLDGQNVGKGAADIDAQSVAHALFLSACGPAGGNAPARETCAGRSRPSLAPIQAVVAISASRSASVLTPDRWSI